MVENSCYPLPLKKGVVPHLNKLAFPCFVPSLVEVGPVVLLEKILWILVTCFCHFAIILPLDKGVVFHLNKLEFTSHKDALCQVRLNSAKWFWKRRLLNVDESFLLFCYHLPWKKVNQHKSNHVWIRVKFGWNWPRGFVEEDKYVKSFRQR